MDENLFDKLYPNFTLEEFRCPCRSSLCIKDGMEYWFLSALQDLRLQVGFPLKINSGYRCAEYNATLPKSSLNSNHIKGIAVDISTSRLSGSQKHRLLRKAFPRFTGIGIYTTFFHLDLRHLHEKSLWIG